MIFFAPTQRKGSTNILCRECSIANLKGLVSYLPLLNFAIFDFLLYKSIIYDPLI